jgi:type VI secretion system protein VasJ
MRDCTQNWCWMAWGKHPVVKDFFCLGKTFPLGLGFSDWVQRGYVSFVSSKKADKGFSSWRFWIQGSGKSMLVCGLLRDSCDALGRPYPLLIIGTGTLEDWETHWDLLPSVCENTWSQIEYVSAQKLNGLEQFTHEIKNIKPPCPDWKGETERRKDFEYLAKSSEMQSFSGNVLQYEKEAFVTVEDSDRISSHEQDVFRDMNTQVGFWNFMFRKQSAEAPNSVFIGGMPGKTFLVCYRRPLTVSDYMQLWTASFERVRVDGSLAVG